MKTLRGPGILLGNFGYLAISGRNDAVPASHRSFSDSAASTLLHQHIQDPLPGLDQSVSYYRDPDLDRQLNHHPGLVAGTKECSEYLAYGLVVDKTKLDSELVKGGYNCQSYQQHS